MNTEDAKTAAADARERLAETLDQIEDKVNIPRRLGELSKSAQDNPVPVLAAVGAAVVAIGGLIAWGVARRR
jgi:hypothetical protein